MPIWRWRTRRSKRFWAESSDAVGQACGSPDHGGGDGIAGGSRLFKCPAVAGGVLQAGRRIESRRRNRYRTQRDCRDRVALGFLEVLRPSTPTRQTMEPKTRASGVLPDAANQKRRTKKRLPNRERQSLVVVPLVMPCGRLISCSIASTAAGRYGPLMFWMR